MWASRAMPQAIGGSTHPVGVIRWGGPRLVATGAVKREEYWIAILSRLRGGSVHYRDTGSGDPDYVSQQTNLSSLPASWTSGQNYINAPLSAYLIVGNGPSGLSQSYTYDPVGNRTSLTNNGTQTAYTYDKADRITSVNGQTYSVDNDGNLTSFPSNTLTYDQANRLTSATISGTTSSYGYDGDGKRASETVGATTTSFVSDVNDPLPNVLADGTRKYVYGLGLAYETDTSGNVQAVYHTDGLGSVRALTDANGNLPQTYQSDPFGVPTQTQGTSSQPFGFTAQQQDVESNFVYLRARYYDAALERFPSRDPSVDLLHS